MDTHAHMLSSRQFRRLQATYRRHGSGPEFWTAYRDILESAAWQGDREAAADALARAAVQLGVTETALIV